MPADRCSRFLHAAGAGAAPPPLLLCRCRNTKPRARSDMGTASTRPAGSVRQHRKHALLGQDLCAVWLAVAIAAVAVCLRVTAAVAIRLQQQFTPRGGRKRSIAAPQHSQGLQALPCGVAIGCGMHGQHTTLFPSSRAVDPPTPPPQSCTETCACSGLGSRAARCCWLAAPLHLRVCCMAASDAGSLVRHPVCTHCGHQHAPDLCTPPWCSSCPFGVRWTVGGTHQAARRCVSWCEVVLCCCTAENSTCGEGAPTTPSRDGA